MGDSRGALLWQVRPACSSEGARVGIGMTKVLHVKIPVTDLQRSVTWYCDLMDLDLSKEFIEGDELRGAALMSPEGGFAFALRLRQYCAGQPDLTGFDVVALHMATRESLEDLRRRCAELGARVHRHPGPRVERGGRGCERSGRDFASLLL